MSLACRGAASLTIRRAQLSTLLSCMESWLLLVESRARASSSSEGFGLEGSALGQLTGISGGGGGGSESAGKGATGYQDLELMMLVTQCLDWIMAGVGDDPDVHSRVLKVEILRIASLGLQREDGFTD